jgi:cytochrome c peroxidase
MFKFEKPSNALLAVLLAAVVMDVVLWWPEVPVRQSAQDAQSDRVVQVPFSQEPIQAIPPEGHADSGRIGLGRLLFEDRRLSADDTISCSHCHLLGQGGVDGRVHSIGIGGAEGNINAPTVFNSGFNFVQFWDGRAATLEEQVEGPIHNPVEMGSNWKQVVGKLEKDERYPGMFGAIYKDGITAANIKDAIATFERSLSTPDSAFDRFLRGDKEAISSDARHGYELFFSYGCIACHQGVNIGGNMYQQMGLMADYFGDRGKVTPADMGRFNVSGDPADRHYFKVPSLRNIALTAPYFHDGSAQTLQQAVRVMAKYQLGRPMPEEDVASIVAFLRALTGAGIAHD